MFSSAFGRLRWVVLGAAVAAVVLGASSASAGNPGDPFLIGVTNSVNASTTLLGQTSPGPQLKVQNTADDTTVFGVYGVLSALSPVSGSSAAVRGDNKSTNDKGYGVYGSHASGGVGVYGGSATGIGVYGKHTDTSGAGAAVRGDSASTEAGAYGVYGLLSATSATYPAAAVRGESNSTNAYGYGVYGSQDGTGTGVYGTSAHGIGVRGEAPIWAVSGDSPSGIGVFGQHEAGSGSGVEGWSYASGGNTQGVRGHVDDIFNTPGAGSAGVEGDNDGTTCCDRYGVKGLGSTGVYGTTNNAGGNGVLGAGFTGVRGTSSTNTGVYGLSTGSNGNGVVGEASNGPVAYGVQGLSTSGYGGYFTGPVTGAYGGSTAPAGYGVSGFASGSYGVGVRGRVTGGANASAIRGIGNNGVGVFGTGANGVVGQSSLAHGIGTVGIDNADTGVGIYGQGTGPNGLAGKFIGNVNIYGTLSKTAGSFRIDHPLDPAHAYLQHSFVESPDMKDVYDGIVTTNGKGFAVVRLPRWFQALNRSFRYQLTSLSGLQQVAVAKEIANNRFTVQSQRPHSRVSWQVTGIRHDPYANAHRIQVVVPKGADAGRYVYPQGYGKPASRQVDLARLPSERRR